MRTMEAHSLGRIWPILVRRLEKAGLTIVPRPGMDTLPAAPDDESQGP
jgi:hypothetical protein